MVPRPMKYVRIYADESGESHLEDVTVQEQFNGPGAVQGRSVMLSEPLAAAEITFCEIATEESGVGTLAPEPHVAPRRQWVIVLSGRVLLTTTGGDECEFVPGDIVFADDTTGGGHWTTPLTPHVRMAIVPVVS